MATKNHWNLVRNLRELSEATDDEPWEEITKEWYLHEIEYTEEEDEEEHHCLCSHKIHQLCYIKNARNNNVALLGNCCIKQFLKNIKTDIIFQCFKRIREDDDKQLNKEMLSYAYNKRIINSWERGFSLNTLRKKKLSEKQLKVRQRINNKIVDSIAKAA